MLSNLRLLVLENPTADFVMDGLEQIEKRRLINWYERSTQRSEELKTVLDAFLWCCTDGEYAADLGDSGAFTPVFKKKADELGITTEMLLSLFFSHDALFGDLNAIPQRADIDAPLFIVFEGLDGSGKSTQINMLRDRLKQMGRRACVTAEPTSSATGGLIRDALSNNYKRTPSEMAALFLIDRISHNVNPVWGIKKLLNEGMDVISDRYYYSSFAYQGMGTDLEWIMDMNLRCPDILRPDLCIYLDVNPARSRSRLAGDRTHLEIFENDESVMEETRKRFLDVFKKLNVDENICVIDANRPINVVADEIFNIVSQYCKK